MEKTTILSMTNEDAIAVLEQMSAESKNNQNVEVSSALMLAIKALRESDAKVVVKATDQAYRRGLKEGRNSITWLDVEKILKIASRRLCKPWLKSESKQALQEIAKDFYED